jgi:hypothetical protein
MGETDMLPDRKYVISEQSLNQISHVPKPNLLRRPKPNPLEASDDIASSGPDTHIASGFTQGIHAGAKHDLYS